MSSFFDYMFLSWDHVLELPIGHAIVVAISLVFAIVIGVSLGVLVYRRERAANVVLTIASTFLTGHPGRFAWPVKGRESEASATYDVAVAPSRVANLSTAQPASTTFPRGSYKRSLYGYFLWSDDGPSGFNRHEA